MADPNYTLPFPPDDEWIKAAEYDDLPDPNVSFALLEVAGKLGITTPWLTRLDHKLTFTILGKHLCRYIIGNVTRWAPYSDVYYGFLFGVSLMDRERIRRQLPPNWHQKDNVPTEEEMKPLADIVNERLKIAALSDRAMRIKVGEGTQRVDADADDDKYPEYRTYREEKAQTVSLPKQINRYPNADDDGPVMKITHDFTGRKVVVTQIRGGELAPIVWNIKTGDALALNLRDFLYNFTIHTEDADPEPETSE